MIDDFNGDNERLVACIEALLDLDAAKALVPHGVGGHARGLLSAAGVRLAAKDAEIAELRKELSEARQDGSRYRWLRDNCDAGASCVLCMRREPEEWAAEIDAALAATPEHLRG